MAYISPYQQRRNGGGNGGGGNQAAQLINLLTVAPALKGWATNSAAVRDAMTALSTLPANAAVADVVPVVNQIKAAFVTAAGSEATTAGALRQQLVLNLVMSGMGGGNSSQALLLVLLLNGGL